MTTDRNNVDPNILRTDVTILAAAQASNVVDLKGTTLISIAIPAGFSGTALTFKGAAGDGDAIQDLHDSYSGLQVTAAAGPDRILLISAQVFAGVRFIQLISDVPQAADITIQLNSRGV